MKSSEAEIECSKRCKMDAVTAIDSEPGLGIWDGDFPEWLLIEVFIRLPVKLIFRLKLVCKQWISVISDPSFVRIYVSRVSLSRQPWVIVSRVMRFDCSTHLDFLEYEVLENIYSRELKRPSFLPLNLPSSQHPHGENYRIFGISNGLVLYGPISQDIDHVLKPTTVYSICNPVTRHWISLPPQSRHSQRVHTGFITQVKDGIIKSYRVVCLDYSFQRKNMIRFDVFFSESGEWKDFCVYSDPALDIFLGRPPFALQGNLHWVLCQNGILAYDPYRKPDGLRIIPLPRDKDQEYNEPRQNGVTSLCGVSDGKLRYFKLSGLMETPHGFSSFGIWILNDYSSGDWSLQHRISRFDILCDSVLCCLSVFILPISFDPFDPDFVYLGYMNVIVSFNIKTKKLVAHGQPLSIKEILEQDPYISYCQLPWWMGLLFLIPPWPTSIPPPCWRSIEK